MVSGAYDYDLVVIGSGPGGYTAALRARQLGLAVALIERDKVGGICLHQGCIPTKSLLRHAEVMRLIRRSREFGISVGEPRLELERVMERTWSVVEQLHQGLQQLLRRRGVVVLRGRGCLADGHTVTVTDQSSRRLTARHILLATGSRPRPLPSCPFDGSCIISSDTALRLETLPQHLVVIGAGAVGVEMATIYHAFGSTVTLLERERALLPMEDAEVSQHLQQAFAQRGIRCLTNAHVLGLEPQPRGVLVRYRLDEHPPETLEGDCVLVAIGRDAIVEALGLDAVGIVPQRGVIAVDATLRTACETVSAIGDCIGGLLLAHRAADQGARVVERLAGRSVEAWSDLQVPRATFADPEVASIGLTEADARALPRNIRVGRVYFGGNAKALCDGEPAGFAKIIADDASGEILGAHLVGHRVTEAIGALTLAQTFHHPALELGRTIHPHPTCSEAVREAARDLWKESLVK